jgi:hypothetical protein
MKTFLIAMMIFPLMGIAQRAEINVLYEKLGIKTLKSEKLTDTKRVYEVYADSVKINGIGTTLNELRIVYEKNEAGSTVMFGEHYSLSTNAKGQIQFSEKGHETEVNPDEPENLDNVNDVRFMIMAIFMDCIDRYDVTEFEFAETKLASKRCGTWDVIGYGHSVSSSLLNANIGSDAFGENNSNCSQVGGVSTSCIFKEHVCFSTFTFYCHCSFTVPFLGIGW